MGFPGGTVVRVTPTLLTAAYADNEVGVNSVEIPNAVSNRGGTSVLRGVSIVCTDAGLNPLGEILFHESEQSFGTAGAQVSLTDAQSKSMGFLGWVNIQATDNYNIGSSADSSMIFYTLGAKADDPPFNNIMLKAAGGSTSCYFTVIPNVAWDFEDTTEMQFIFSIEYLD